MDPDQQGSQYFDNPDPGSSTLTNFIGKSNVFFTNNYFKNILLRFESDINMIMDQKLCFGPQYTQCTVHTVHTVHTVNTVHTEHIVHTVHTNLKYI